MTISPERMTWQSERLLPRVIVFRLPPSPPPNYQPRHDHRKILTSQMTLKRSRNTDTNRAEITAVA